MFNNNWEIMDHDTRDDSHTPLIDIVILQQGNPLLTLEMEENEMFEFVRKESNFASSLMVGR